jgi:uncharacterized protein YciI
MTIFAVTYRYSDDVATRDNLRTEHRDYLRRLADRGLLLVSGPFGPDEAPGALLLFRADDKAHVDALVEKDPFTPSGVIAQTDTAEWEPVIGPLLLPVLTGDRQTGTGTPTSDTSVPSSTDATHTSTGSDRA